MKVFANYADSEGTAFPEDSGGSRLAVLRDVDTRSAEDLRFGLSGDARLADSWRLNFLATKYDHESEFFSPGVAPGVRDPVPPNGATSDLDRFDVAVNAVVEMTENITATMGLDFYDEDGISDGFVEFAPGFNVPAGFNFDRSVTGVFGEIHARTESGLSLLGSLRHDNPDNESGETTARLGAKYDFPSGRASVQANWGQGFALPGFFALASPLVGNPDLRPETSESFDIGVTFRTGDNRLATTVTVFHNEFENLIDFDSNVFQMVNRDTLKADGVEWQMTFDAVENLQIEAHATYMDLSLAGTSDPLRQRPEWRGGLSLSWDPNEYWQVRGSWLSIGETFDSSVPTGVVTLDGYQRADVTITYRQSDTLNLVLSVDNLLDESYEQAIGFAAPGTRARFGLRYLF